MRKLPIFSFTWSAWRFWEELGYPWLVCVSPLLKQNKASAVLYITLFVFVKSVEHMRRKKLSENLSSDFIRLKVLWLHEKSVSWSSRRAWHKSLISDSWWEHARTSCSFCWCIFWFIAALANLWSTLCVNVQVAQEYTPAASLKPNMQSTKSTKAVPIPFRLFILGDVGITLKTCKSPTSKPFLENPLKKKHCQCSVIPRRPSSTTWEKHCK